MSDVINGAIDYLLTTAGESKIDIEVLAMQRQSTAISFNQRKLDQFSFSETHQIGVRVIDGHHEGVAYSESLEHTSLEAMLAAARDNARMIEKDFVSELRGKHALPTLDFLYNPKLDDVAIEQKIKAASILESTALDFSKDIQSVAYSGYGDSSANVFIANTKGLRGDYRVNYCSAYAYCLAKDGDGAVMSSEGEAYRSFDKLNVADIASTAARKTLDRRGAVRPQTGSYTVVFENRAAESLLGLILGYFNGKAVDESRSPLKGRLNEKVFSSQLSLIDDPFFATGTSGRPFDEEGYPAQKTTLIENGVVKNFLTNSVLARKMKLPHTASAARAPSTDLDVSTTNVLVRPGQHTLDQLLSSDGKVIYVTRMLGFAGFRAASGDFSIPMEGYLFEQGKLSCPLKDFLISGNILKVLEGVEAIGNDVRNPMGGVISPSLMVRGLNVAGKS